MRGLRADTVYLLLEGVMSFAFGLVFTVTGVYFVTVVGMNPLQLVLVGTALELTAFLFEIPTGVVADTYSRRLSVIIGIFVLGAAFVLRGLAPVFEFMLLGSAILGIGYTFLSGAAEAWIADEVGEERAGRVYLQASQIGQAAGLVSIGASVALASIQLTLPIVLGGLLLITLGVLLIVVMPENGFAPAPREDRRSWQTLGRTLQEGTRLVRGRPILLLLVTVAVFAGASSEGFDRLSDAHFLTNVGFPALGALEPVVWFGILSASGRILSIIATEIVKRRVDTTNAAAIGRALLVLNVALLVSTIAFGLAGNFMFALLTFWSVGLLRTLINPLSTTWLNQHVEPQVRATVISTRAVADAFGQTAVGPAVGAVGLFWSIRAALVAAGLLLAPVLLLLAQALRRDAAAQTQAAALSETTEV
jgi:DHA3 family tetracycline resistance protein-like MFS transporter